MADIQMKGQVHTTRAFKDPELCALRELEHAEYAMRTGLMQNASMMLAEKPETL
jgi:hypothetical protein